MNLATALICEENNVLHPLGTFERLHYIERPDLIKAATNEQYIILMFSAL